MTMETTRERDVLVGSYVLDEEIGRGMMGVVYRAHHQVTGHEVAVKVLFDNVAAAAGAVERFRREVRISSLVDHPGIIQVYDAGEFEQTYYYAMELLGGTTLGDVADSLSLPELVLLVAEMLEALAICHDAGIVHRDVKPENVHIDETDDGDFRVCLIDFGIANVKESPRATQTGVTVGTPCYMAPEQAMQSSDASPAADVWAVGVMLYELATGRLPFEGPSAAATMIAAIQDELPPIESDPGVPPGLSDVIERSLRKDPDERFSDAGELHTALLDALERWNDSSSDADSSAPRAQTLPLAEPVGENEPEGSTRMVPGIAIASVAVLVLVAWLFWGRDVATPTSKAVWVPSPSPEARTADVIPADAFVIGEERASRARRLAEAIIASSRDEESGEARPITVANRSETPREPAVVPAEAEPIDDDRSDAELDAVVDQATGRSQVPTEAADVVGTAPGPPGGPESDAESTEVANTGAGEDESSTTSAPREDGRKKEEEGRGRGRSGDEKSRESAAPQRDDERKSPPDFFSF